MIGLWLDCDGFPHFILGDRKSKGLGILKAWPESLIFFISSRVTLGIYIPLVLLVLVFLSVNREKYLLSWYLQSSRSPLEIPRGFIYTQYVLTMKVVLSPFL